MFRSASGSGHEMSTRWTSDVDAPRQRRWLLGAGRWLENCVSRGMLISLIVALVAVLMLRVEVAKPGRTWPVVRGWWMRAVVFNALQAGCVYLAGIRLEGWLALHGLRWGHRFGTLGGTLVGYLVITFVYYWWHRWRHESDLLWRWLHQLHHSPQRLEVLTSFYKHPLEMLSNSVISLAVLYLCIGVTPGAATGAQLLTGLAELFYHWNVRTPYWLGFVFQRPESHCVHHERDQHSGNYADLPLWDMLFGTFHNPRGFDRECGFGPAAERRVVAMLAGVVVTPPR